MNRTSRTDEPLRGDGYNQNPNALSNDLTTNQDLNGLANSREMRTADVLSLQSPANSSDQEAQAQLSDPIGMLGEASTPGRPLGGNLADQRHRKHAGTTGSPVAATTHAVEVPGDRTGKSPLDRIKMVLVTFSKFVGPGFMVAVAYIDPGNYATAIAAGASYQFRLLFIVLLANIFAIFLQTLSIKLGTVSGLNLAEACRAFLPRWLNYVLYAFAEVAIIATDIAEVIGTAIALNLLFPQLPLVAGCALSILDVLVILMFYQPYGSMRGLRAFEFFVVALVLGVVICFCIQLSLIKDTSIGEVFKGYLPSSAVVEQQGLYQACGILGATVMPHSLYLGSGIVQSRLRDYDRKHGLLPLRTEPPSSASSTNDGIPDPKSGYMPSLASIRYSLKYSIAELAISLFTFALFVNSAILIVAGASLYQNADAENADIFEIHNLLSQSISPAAGTVFALALLLSGISAGIVCTIAGQMVSEGALRWTLRPWIRRLITRSISITPSIIIAGAVGREGLDAALNGSQVVLSVVLPFVTAPLIWFTCLDRYMTVRAGNARLGEGRMLGSSRTDAQTGTTRAATMLGAPDARPRRHDGITIEHEPVKMGNSWLVCMFAVLVWLLISAMNVANLVLLGKGS